jgi:hypothetical protein
VHTAESAYWLEVHGGALTRGGRQIAASTALSSLSPLGKC